MKYTILLILSTLFASQVFSQNVTKAEAELTAQSFFLEKANQFQGTKHQKIYISESFEVYSESHVVYYVVNIKPTGYVLVSASKKVKPVLAYSFQTTYNEKDQPPQFTAWVNQYADQISFAIQNQSFTPPGVTEEWNNLLHPNPELKIVNNKEKSVEPMLISTWDQGQFYNQMCPSDPGGPAGHCLTGCVATAMGQLCFYFRWPDTGTGSYTYQHPTYGTISANFEETDYRWNEMTNAVTEQNTAVAELLYHLGVSVDMDFGPNGSGMWNHKAAYSLRTYFKFNPETEYLYRDSTNLDWDSTILAHLDMGVPMYYAGWSVPNVNGHAFIIDGYQTTDYFHFNWGWGGSYDGYFYLDELTPGGSNFNLAQELVINCYPDDISYTYPPYCGSPDTLNTLNGTIEDGSGPRSDYENNASCSWLIDPQTVYDSVSYILLEFDKLRTEIDQDVITIYDGPDESSPILGQYSGTTLPETIYSTGNKVLVTFNSNASTTDEGWFISYESVKPVWCSGLVQLTGHLDTISDGSGSFYYQHGAACMWNIQPEGSEEITIYFTSFDTEEVFDKVKVYNAGNNELLATYSGTYDPGNMPDPVTSPSGKMLIAFSTNGTVTHQGWEAYYSSVSVGMEETVQETLHVYPNPADNNLFIEAGKNEQIKSYEIQSLEGKILISGNAIDAEHNNIINVSLKDISSGIYLIKVNTDNISICKKIIIR